MKKASVFLFTFFLFLCGCSNNSSDTLSAESYTSLMNEINNLKSQIKSLENKLEDLESNIIMESTDADKSMTEPYNDIIDDPNIPEDYKNALIKAIQYGENEYLSKSAIYENLTSKSLNFSEEAAQYAIDNYECDYFFNALNYTNKYDRLTNLSKIGMYNHLTSNSVKFTEEEAQYAIENTDADWERNALNLAKLYQGAMSIDGIRQALEMSEFTEAEIDYAIESLEMKQEE